MKHKIEVQLVLNRNDNAIPTRDFENGIILYGGREFYAQSIFQSIPLVLDSRNVKFPKELLSFLEKSTTRNYITIEIESYNDEVRVKTCDNVLWVGEWKATFTREEVVHMFEYFKDLLISENIIQDVLSIRYGSAIIEFNKKFGI